MCIRRIFSDKDISTMMNSFSAFLFPVPRSLFSRYERLSFYFPCRNTSFFFRQLFYSSLSCFPLSLTFFLYFTNPRSSAISFAYPSSSFGVSR